MSDIERRRAPRAAVSLPIRLSPRGEAEPATLKNLSTSGIACEFGEAISEMTVLAIALELPGASKPVEMTGAVVRCDKVRGVNPPTYEMGIFFTDMTNEARARIHNFVAGHVDAPASRETKV